MTVGKRLTLLAAFGALVACTPTEHAAWLRWHEQDPAAADAYADKWLADHLALEPAASSSSVWDDLAECESGQHWGYNGGSGYDGGLQFAPSTWRAYGGEDFASHAWGASREAQIVVAERVLADVGWGAWPTCSRKLGLR